MIHDSIIRDRLVTGDKTASDVTRDIARPILNNPTTAWKVGFTLSLIFLGIFGVSLLYTLWTGIGVWNINKSVMWGWDITNFVFWVGIGHAGTLISAVLLLFRQKWRMSINRSAEAMTIFAVICAAMFPVFHMGRVWVGYWALPLPNAFGSLWVNFNSPLLWDVFAISTYFSVSLLFWYIGLIPDIATIRDKVKSKLGKTMYGFFSMGWTGSTRTWARYELISLITIVSTDFATSVIPGWHTTIFPPYFVAGAIFSGFGMVATLLVVARKVMNYENYITIGHLDAMTKIIMVTGTIVGIAYLTEFFIAWYSGNIYEQYAFTNRMFGPYWWAYWSMMTCNLIAPQVFWFRWARTTPWFIFIMSIVVNVGMWFERFVIIVTSLHRDYLPSSWVMYQGSLTEIGLFLGTFGIFFTCFFLFAKFLPVINMAEVKSILRNRE
jgi:molybdopterin-containing oxidoreductase family membrane subunit